MSLFSENEHKDVAEVHKMVTALHEKMIPVVSKQQEEIKKYGATLGQTADRLSNLEKEYKENVEVAHRELKSEFEKRFEEFHSVIDSLKANEQKLFVAQSDSKQLQGTLGQNMARIPDYKKLLRQKNTYTCSRENKSFDGIVIDDYKIVSKALQEGMDLKFTLGFTGSSLTDLRDVQTTTRLNEIFAEPLQMERIRDFIPVIPVSGSAVQYWQQTDYAEDLITGRENVWSGNNAAMVAETGSKPYSSLQGEMQTAVVNTLAHLFVVSEQILDDAVQFARHVDLYGRTGLDEKENIQIVRGGGTGANMEGLLVDPGVRPFQQSVHGEIGDTTLDTICRAMGLIKKNQHRPDGLWLGIGAETNLKLIKGNDGHYIWGLQALMGGRLQLWGLPVLGLSSLADDEGIVGAFRSCVALLDRMVTTLRITDSHDDIFDQNLLALRFERRVGLMKVRLAGLRKLLFDGPRES